MDAPAAASKPGDAIAVLTVVEVRDARVWQRNSPDQGALYTRKRRPVVLVWSAHFESMIEAFAFEKRVQGWNRTKREALIRGDFDFLPELSRRAHLRPRNRR